MVGPLVSHLYCHVCHPCCRWSPEAGVSGTGHAWSTFYEQKSSQSTSQSKRSPVTIIPVLSDVQISDRYSYKQPADSALLALIKYDLLMAI